MRSKPFLISAAGIAALVVLFGFLFVVRPARHQAATASHEKKIVGEPPRPTTPAPPTTAPAFGTDGKIAATLPLASHPGAPAIPNALGIRPEHLDDARKLADDMAANREQYQSAMGDPAYFNQSLNGENPSRKLALRLGLDPDTSKKAEGILSAHLAEQIKHRLDAEQKRMTREGQLLASDRESYVNYLAIQSMAARGETLSPEQQAFFEKFRGILDPEGSVPEKSETTNWYENPGLIEAMNQELSAEQQAGLADYVEEQQRRAREVQALHAQMRSNMIAEKLGLDDADRTALFEYLQKHPDASRSDVSKIVAPELIELLPEGM